MQGYTTISNGSKWFGEEPDRLAVLAERLKTYRLDPTFKDSGCYIYHHEGGMRLFGNFFSLSAVFNIQLTNPALIKYFRHLVYFNIKHMYQLK